MESLVSVPYGYCHCRCGEETTIAQKSHTKSGRVRGRPLMYKAGHNMRVSKPRVRKGPPTEAEKEAALKKKQNHWRNKPDERGEFPEYVKPNTCGKHNPPAVWLGNVRCPRCSKVEKTPLVHNEYEEAEDWADPYTERGWEIKKAYQEEDKTK